jgi:glycosyltransferase involved in cell wall biosynthesis
MAIVTVIMSVYNGGKKEMLEQCIKSVLEQSHDELEFIICNDGSTDRTQDIIEEMCQYDRRIRLINNLANEKASAARNRCIKQAKGEYIAIMDADDYNDLNRIGVQYSFLKNHAEFDFVGTGAYLFDDSGVWGTRRYVERPEKNNFKFVLPFVHASVMFRKAALLKVAGYNESPKVLRSEDYDLFMRLYAAGCQGANLEQILYYVREDQDAWLRRKYRYRWNEMIVRYEGFKKLKLMPGAWPYVLKPLIVGLIPQKLLTWMKSKYYNK